MRVGEWKTRKERNLQLALELRPKNRKKEGIRKRKGS